MKDIAFAIGLTLLGGVELASAQSTGMAPETSTTTKLAWANRTNAHPPIPHPAHSLAEPSCPASSGPDIVVGDITGPVNYASATGLDALSLGTTACNIGSVWVDWMDEGNHHPVIASNLYRLRFFHGASRFEQIGMSWLKHGFYAVNDTLCCPTCTPTDGTHLGVGCADAYTAWRNGFQYLLGPRWQVNAFTGAFPFPPANPPFSSSTARRLEVALSDLAPANSSTRYFGEAQYVAADDAAAGNAHNNASYIELAVAGNVADFRFYLAGETHVSRPAIAAWSEYDSTVSQTAVQIPQEGLFILAYDVTQLQARLWHYEYALYNMNSDRSGQRFAVPIQPCVNVMNMEFHGVRYRNGDGPNGVGYSDADWTVSRDATTLQWATQTFQENPSANALRWGTLYNFRFDADAPPRQNAISLALFKPAGSGPNSVTIVALGPGSACLADVAPPHDDGTVGDQWVGIDDLLTVVNNWGHFGGVGDVAPGCGDGFVGIDDLLAVVNSWGPCP